MDEETRKQCTLRSELDQAQAAKYRACVEALREARETLEHASPHYGFEETIAKIDAALAGLEE
jgi:hypothetical protein